MKSSVVIVGVVEVDEEAAEGWRAFSSVGPVILVKKFKLTKKVKKLKK